MIRGVEEKQEQIGSNFFREKKNFCYCLQKFSFDFSLIPNNSELFFFEDEK